MLETKKVNLLDIVELAEDLPENGVKRGEQGVVVEVFEEPEEAYILEFADPSGTSSRLAYWVKPAQVVNINQIGEETLGRGLAIQNQEREIDAEKE